MRIRTLNTFKTEVLIDNEIYDEESFWTLESEDLTLMGKNEILIIDEWSKVQNHFDDLFSALKDYSKEVNIVYSYDIVKEGNSAFTVSIYNFIDGKQNLIMVYKIKLEFSA